MSLVATLICNPADPALDSTVVDGARAILPSPGPAHWLFDEVAVDIPFTGSEDIRAIDARLREARGDLPIDIVVQPAGLAAQEAFLADMDSTMIGQECIDELADFAGLKAHVAAITERAMRGEIEFEPALRERVALLKGLPVSVVDEVLQKRITPTPGGRELVATMRAHGAYTCLISGGFTLFTNAVAAMIGFQENRANELMVEDGKLTGEVGEPILGRATKLATLIELRESFDLDDIDTLAVGDGANDLGMIEHAGLGVAYHAKPAVAAAAAARIDHGDLTALLYAQGYRRDEFVGAIGLQRASSPPFFCPRSFRARRLRRGCLARHVRFQRGADAGLIARAALLKPAKHRGIQPQGDQCLGSSDFGRPRRISIASDRDRRAQTFRRLVPAPHHIRAADDVAINFLQVASQSALFPGHWLSSIEIHVARCRAASKQRLPFSRATIPR